MLAGQVAEKTLDSIVLDVHGVGYGVFVSAEDYGRLQTDQQAKLYIYEHIREAAYDLFGFISTDTKRLFEQLLGVNGVGPKMALSVLSVGNAAEVRNAIAGGDLKFIQRASGVGKRVAERIALDLKNKVGLSGFEPDAAFFQSDTVLAQDEATEALIALGFTPQDAAKALQGIDVSLATEERVKLALKKRP